MRTGELHSTLNILGVFVEGLSHKAGSQMLIRAGDRWPPGRLIAGTVFLSHLAKRNGTSDLAHRGLKDPLLSAWHCGTSGQQRGLLRRAATPSLGGNLGSEDRDTCVSVESVHDVGRAAVFICSFMPE